MNANKIITLIMDIASILFPAIVAVLGVLNLTGIVQYVEGAQTVLMIALSAAGAIASVIYNFLQKQSEKISY